MIDLHIHVLPCLDDGPSRIEDALEMCRVCQDEGIHTLVATPHQISGIYENTRDDILRHVATFQERIEQQNLALRILPGSDVRLDPDIPSLLDRGEICTVNDNQTYLLIELPEDFPPMALTRMLSTLKAKGIRTILSHPERHLAFQRDVQGLYNLVYSGVAVQVTAWSLLGGFGRKTMEFSKRLLEHRLVHLIASDAHSPDLRPPGLRRAVDLAAEIIGRERALCLVEENPGAVIQGKALPLPKPKPWVDPKKSRWTQWLKKGSF